MAEKYIMYIISHQSEEGWLGEDDSKDGNRYWSKYYVMFVLRMYYEATGNETVFPVMYKFLHCAYKRMFSTPFGTSWYMPLLTFQYCTNTPLLFCVFGIQVCCKVAGFSFDTTLAFR